ncbi:MULTISPECIES: ABC transporter substrate-binding protein [Brucella]|uniref:ABC transporter substrate-binding protein n=1 Tax=Brucella pituitosa TaxID=571256 RepID=A0A643EWW1_9HYPH|nr:MULTISPECIES: ABC transporter substrate-binding protein [Brucella]PQZ47674.1 amino acid ABC transporter substrate-binding protein [Ochrobactrum sp. MYb19]PRA53089.1 amino acid ABC transporter substrate-binding protein [Ochrobactrum sp. MYb68]PRA63351.1 amino acid ABC transporter substrate-binding protein [Ochrobactrum sp. MYb18]PRA73294.1 amino acid ABC transporter substrate-binding protein [Brucella thiophenivorans]PRA83731.1 amino acid ABC transporter substrate-binding protein [Ochrobactr
MSSKLKSLIAIAAVAIAASFSNVPAQADELEKLKETGEMRIAMSGQYPPFSFTNEKNEVVGFDASIGAEIADRMGMKPKIVTTPFDGIIAGLLAKKYDAVVASMTITPEREKAVDFVGPYYHAGRTIVVKDSSSIQKLEELNGKTVGVTMGDAHEKWAKAQGDLTVRTYKGLPEMLIDLEAGRIDALVMDSIPVMIAVKETGQKVRILDTPNIEGGRVALGIAIRKNNPELKAAMQKTLDDMLADGGYEKISMQWIGSDIR